MTFQYLNVKAESKAFQVLKRINLVDYMRDTYKAFICEIWFIDGFKTDACRLAVSPFLSGEEKMGT